MKNYTVDGALRDLGSKIEVIGKTVFVQKDLGIGTWGKIDFLKRNGYKIAIATK